MLTKTKITAVVRDMAFGNGAWYAASDTGLLVSHDSGANWVLVAAGSGNAAVRAVGISATDGSAWVIAGDALLTSRDAGKNWNSSPLSFEPRGHVHLHASDSSNLLMASDQGVFESHDGGQSWETERPAGAVD